MHPGFTPDGPATGLFPSTRWSLIVQAAAPATPQAREAVEELCSLYWYPVYAFIRRKGNDPDWALDLTQDSALFDIPCEQATAALGPGDSLLLYTDGVTESHGPGGMFGQERLVTAILGGRRGSDLLDALLSEVVAFSNSPGNQDDITLLALDLAEPVAADDVVLGV